MISGTIHPPIERSGFSFLVWNMVDLLTAHILYFIYYEVYNILTILSRGFLWQQQKFLYHEYISTR
jgi:hypothetical protein